MLERCEGTCLSKGERMVVTTHANFSVGDPHQLTMGRTLKSLKSGLLKSILGSKYLTFVLWVLINIYMVGRFESREINKSENFLSKLTFSQIVDQRVLASLSKLLREEAMELL